MNLDWEEKNDRPRGIVAKANRYAAEKVPIDQIASSLEGEMGQAILASAQAIYIQHFNAFIAGAHAALELDSVKERQPK